MSLDFKVKYNFDESGQVRVFNVHIQSKLLKCTPVMGTGTGLRRFPLSGKEKKKRGGGEGFDEFRF